MSLYDRYLAARTRWNDADLPQSIALVITERDLLNPGAYSTLEAFFRWAFENGARRVMVYVSVLDEAAVPTLESALSEIETPRELAIRVPDDNERVDTPIQVSIGLGGKAEFAKAVQQVTRSVEQGELTADAIDETQIEQHLVFPTDPDLIIKTGAERLSDFMIWQSVYSELYFTDINWRDFRKRDYLRAILDFQERQRRFGA
ncbi:undecaprenyl diphosphate synthase family protein [Halocatena pleomorpha]|uniref:UDP diphosphate synthase n=1 Tax=Halocatena pleomorpha TaxID=1785090 RepID=A0A3P3R3W8_9EURY|nr:undecaprenyl diphosphate synthase family protein [Halocatena pleomorpha]RRJ28166.1 UDP diphosphate synthase [Halocatena pleomorpha]